MIKLITPVVLLCFNRPDNTMKVFEKIRQYQPEVLYIVSDGARADKNGESVIVESLRANLENGVDWKCKINKIYSSENLGCAKRVVSALNIVFANEESAIILEDDCVPNDSFFEFCQIMLERYKDDDRILSICGSTEIKYNPSEERDYYFTKIFGCWGWATWNRAWRLLDYDMKNYAEERKNPIFRKTLFNRNAYWNMMAQFEVLAKAKDKFSWAYIFYYYSILNDGFHILPKYNLIENIGFNDNSTHTHKMPKYLCIETQELKFPLLERTTVEWEKEYDATSFRVTQGHGWIVRIKHLLGLDINKSIFSSD